MKRLLATIAALACACTLLALSRPASADSRTRILPGTYQPSWDTGCTVWLRSDLGITLATGVSEWDDQIAGDANRNLTQVTGSKRPTWTAADATFNGYPSLSFTSASGTYLQSGTWASALAVGTTWIVVGLQTATYQYFIEGISSTHRQGLGMFNASTELSIYSGAELDGNLTTVATSPGVFAGVFNASSSAVYQNSSVTSLATGSSMTGQTMTGLTVGGTFNGTGNMTGKIAEVIGFNYPATSAQLKQKFAYLGARYAVAVK